MAPSLSTSTVIQPHVEASWRDPWRGGCGRISLLLCKRPCWRSPWRTRSSRWGTCWKMKEEGFQPTGWDLTHQTTRLGTTLWKSRVQVPPGRVASSPPARVLRRRHEETRGFHPAGWFSTLIFTRPGRVMQDILCGPFSWDLGLNYKYPLFHFIPQFLLKSYAWKICSSWRGFSSNS